VLSLGKITLRGRAENSPPPIRCGLRLSTAATGLVNYNAVGIFREEDLKPGLTGYQDIDIILKFNGMDKTKTYRADFWLHPSEDGITGIDFATNYWDMKITNEQYGASNQRYGFFK